MIISLYLLPFNNYDTSTLLHCSFGSCYSFKIFFPPFSLAMFCTSEVLQNLGSDHHSIMITVPLSTLFHPNKGPLPTIFRKFVWTTFFYTLILSFCTLILHRNTPLFLFPLLPLSLLYCISLALSAPNFRLLSATSNANLMPRGLLKWKMR